MGMRPTGTAMNILRVFHQATAEEMQSGLTWYKDAIELVQRRVRAIVRKGRTHLPTDRITVAGIVAALSPNKYWTTNIALVEQLYTTGKAGHVTVQVNKSLAILNGEHPLEVLTGQKERAFFQCLSSPNTNAVTIDGHAYSIWIGKLVYTTRVRMTDRLFRLAVEDYRQVAEMVGLKPSQVQAITWIVWRRMNNSRGHIHESRAKERNEL